MTRDGLIRSRREAEKENENSETQCTIGGAPPRLCKYVSLIIIKPVECGLIILPELFLWMAVNP